MTYLFPFANIELVETTSSYPLLVFSNTREEEALLKHFWTMKMISLLSENNCYQPQMDLWSMGMVEKEIINSIYRVF